MSIHRQAVVTLQPWCITCITDLKKAKKAKGPSLHTINLSGITRTPTYPKPLPPIYISARSCYHTKM
jgi:hypothetical protein